MSSETGVAASTAEPRPSHQFVVWTLIVLGTIVMILSTLNSWLERRLLDTDTWVETSTELLDDAAVREELSIQLVNALYENVDVGPAIDDRLPEQLKGLGGPLAGVLREPLIGTTDRILQTAALQAVWEEANRAAQTAVVAVLEDDVIGPVSTAEGKVVIDLNPALRSVGEQIGLSEDVLDEIPADAGVFEVAESDKLERAQTAVRVIKILSAVFFVVVVGLFAAAIYLATNWRRRAVRNVGFATAIGGFVVLIALRFGIGLVADQPDTEGGRAAFNAILTIGTALLRQMAWSEILIGLLVALGASLVGPARYAVWVRRHVATGFGSYRIATWIGLFVLVLAVLVWSPFTAAGNWLTVLIVLGLVVVGVEALRRTSLAEEATRVEEDEAQHRQESLTPPVAAASAESGADGS